MRGRGPLTLAASKTPDEVIMLRRPAAADFVGLTGAEGLEPPTYGFGDARTLT
jgi:hypothetical protein